MAANNLTPESVGLPRRTFLYTLDQVGTLIQVDIKNLKISHLYFEGRSTGMPTRHSLRARDIAPPDSERPDWRVEEGELIRWMKVKGFRAYE